MELDLQTAGSWAGGTAYNADGVLIKAVVTDTRLMQPGALFVCLKGENFDGNDFIETAFKQGAAAVMTDNREKLGAHPGIVVGDPLLALGNLAHQNRWQRHLIPWVAVTGSNGKTTTRSLIAHILRISGEVLEPEANFNNAIGLPVTMLRTTEQIRYGVVEMGTSNPGEIHRLAEIAAPTVAVLTHIAPAHLQGFGTLEAIAREKAEIFYRLPQDGLAVYPAQSPFVKIFREKIPHGVKHTTFAIDAAADLTATDVRAETAGSRFTIAGQEFFLPLLGKHNIGNCLAAVAAAQHLGISLAQAAEAVADFHAVAERLQPLVFPKFTVIDDVYNANPESMRAAAQALVDYPAKHRVMVIGDMAELGAQSKALHEELGDALTKMNIDAILAVGKEMLALAESAHARNARQVIRYFPSVLALNQHLEKHMCDGDVILVKGSHVMNLRRVVNALKKIAEKSAR